MVKYLGWQRIPIFVVHLISSVALSFAIIPSVMSEQLTEMPNSSSPANAQVYFLSPTNGQVFNAADSEGIAVEFGLNGMKVSPAGLAVPDSGHHHLLINMNALPDLTKPLPASDQVLHFGKGQTSTRIQLPPGSHRLQLVLGNHIHIPHTPPVMSKVIEIEIK
jgi:hypothetical protein